MKYLLRFTTIVTCAILILVTAVEVRSDVQRSYIENFLTDQYKDAANTTVNWNTSKGQLELPPFTPSFMGSFVTPGNAVNAAVSGNIAYVADQLSGLHVINIIDPTNPVLIGSYDTNGNAQDVAVNGRYAYVADDVFDLKIIDVSNPMIPFQVGATVNLPGNALAVTVSGGYAFLANGSAGLHIIDVSDPTAPVLLGSYNTPGWAKAVVVDGDYAYVGDSFSGLQIIDITDPTAPTLVGNYDTAGSAGGVAVDGNFAYVAEQQTGLMIFDISDRTNPALLESIGLEGSPWNIEISGNHAFVTARSAGLHMVDISDPMLASIVRSYDTSGDAWGVTHSGNFAYVSDFAEGLKVLRVSNPAPPSIIGNNSDPLRGLGITLSGSYAFISDRDFVLRVIDITDPTSPVSAGSFTRPDYDTRQFIVHGDYGFLANGEAGLKVLDLDDPTSPALVGNFSAPGHVLRAVTAGDLLFMATNQMGLQILDISDPVVPTLVGAYYSTPGYSKDVAVSGQRAYVADEAGGLLVFDISDTTNPTIVNTFDSPGTAMGVAISGQLLFLADGESGMHILSIGASPMGPTLIGSLNTPGFAEKVAVAGDWAFVADGPGGLHMIDVSDETLPVLFGTHDPGFGSTYDVTISGEHAYISGMFGMQVIEVFQRNYHLGKNVGQSLNLSQTGKEVVQVKVNTTQMPDIRWEISADDGNHWQNIVPDGNWNSLDYPGASLIWRSTHEYMGSGVNPTCSDLAIEWFLSVPVIESITDIPDDQGGQLRMNWSKSGFDNTSASPRIVEYSIYRMIDQGMETTPLAYDPKGRDLEPLQYPPGEWDYVMTVPADGEESYSTVVPTLMDSDGGEEIYTMFFVRARTDMAGLYYDSFIDSGYSIDNLAPPEPEGFAVTYEPVGNHLFWDPSPAEDFHYFNIYRALGNDETSLQWEPVEQSTGTVWDDTPEYGGWNVSYKLTAVDSAGNESDPSFYIPGDVTGIQSGNTPKELTLHQNTPNPFNPSTTIFYDVPEGAGVVTLRVFDVRGALVRTLVNEHVAAGKKTARWDGTDERGQRVSSGIYFYRLTSSDHVLTRKMVLLK